MLNLESPPGFRGLDPDAPITWYRRHLPHMRQDGATYFVTFRLADSLPQSKLVEIDALRQSFYQRYGEQLNKEQADTLLKEEMTRIEKWLDQGMGQCHLKDQKLASLVASSLQFFNDERYDLSCFVVMSNHVHANVKPLHPKRFPLEDILHSWKRFTANEINAKLGLEGPFWQPESFDRIIRDDEHLYRVIQYIGSNPKRANLRPGQYQLWLRPEWEALGWGFRES